MAAGLKFGPTAQPEIASDKAARAAAQDAERALRTGPGIRLNPSRRPAMRFALAIRIAFGDCGDIWEDYDAFGVS